MNSFNLHRATSALNGENKKNDSALIQSTRAEFFETYQPQSYSLPDNIMFYITKNPSTPELYQKMIQTCKDFFVKNPILAISELEYDAKGEWYVNRKRFSLDNITSKLWITSELFVHPNYSNKNKDVHPTIASSLTPKIFRCDVKELMLDDQILSLADLCLLASSAKDVTLCNVTVKENDGTIVGIEKIVDVAVKAKKIELHHPPVTSFTTKVMKQFVQIPSICKLDFFTLTGIPETFDIEAFYVYMKKNQNTSFFLVFDNSVSEAYKSRLEEIVDEILATEVFNYKPAFIRFPGILQEKEFKLYSFCSAKYVVTHAKGDCGPNQCEFKAGILNERGITYLWFLTFALGRELTGNTDTCETATMHSPNAAAFKPFASCDPLLTDGNVVTLVAKKATRECSLTVMNAKIWTPTTPTPTTSEAPDSEGEETSNATTIWIIVGVGLSILVIIIVGLGVWYYCTRMQKKTGDGKKNIIHASQKTNIEAAVATKEKAEEKKKAVKPTEKNGETKEKKATVEEAKLKKKEIQEKKKNR